MACFGKLLVCFVSTKYQNTHFLSTKSIHTGCPENLYPFLKALYPEKETKILMKQLEAICDWDKLNLVFLLCAGSRAGHSDGM